MLSRAILPLVRRRAAATPAGAKTYLSAYQTRFYSAGNHNSSSNSPSKSASNPSSNASQKPRVASQPGSSQPKESSKDFSESQTEFETNAESHNNTAPRSTGGGAGVNQGREAESSRQADFSENQAEFETKSAAPKDGAEEPKHPLPDLTQGIPSTLAAELEGQSKRRGTSLNLTEDPQAYEEEGAGGGRGDNPKNPYVSSLERRRNQVAQLTFFAMLAAGISGTVYLGRNWDTKEEEDAHTHAPSGWGFGLFFDRIKARMSDITSYYRDPPFEKLLPEDDPQFRQPYTLVLSLEDFLVHSEWSREHGWRIAKRPGADYFLRYLSQYYEIVLFTSVPSMMADQVLRKLDPYRIIRWPLFREATIYEDGEHIKVRNQR